jgi:hypothetical protein
MACPVHPAAAAAATRRFMELVLDGVLLDGTFDEYRWAGRGGGEGCMAGNLCGVPCGGCTCCACFMEAGFRGECASAVTTFLSELPCVQCRCRLWCTAAAAVTGGGGGAAAAAAAAAGLCLLLLMRMEMAAWTLGSCRVCWHSWGSH